MLRLKEFKKATGISITVNHTVKMEGVASLSTSPLCNAHCEKHRHCRGSICEKCYSQNMLARFGKNSGLYKNLARNADVLTTRILSEEEMPRLYSETGFFRFEAFGDLINEIQVLNYFNIARANSHMKCALWSKLPHIIQAAMEKYDLEKPDNLTIIGSSYAVNKSMESYYRKFPFIDNCFTVYTADYIKANNIDIRCGGRSCADCGKCYLGNHSEFNISEKLK